MATTMIIAEHGGPEMFKPEDREIGEPGAGEIRIRHEAAGLNFIDVYQRTGLYPMGRPMRSAWRLRGSWKPWVRASRI